VRIMAKETVPAICPACHQVLRVTRLICDNCSTAVEGGFTLPVLGRLDAEDQAFVLSILKASGSLKELARLYGISYPTVRNRLDTLIDKVKALESDVAKQKEG
jgi:hypothetical protein